SCRISPSLSFLVSSLATTGLSSLSLHDALPIYVQALRAIWTAWNAGERLAFRGEFYSHTLMTPFFSPGPNPYGPPAVYLAAVGDLMTRVAGEVCDGLMPHPFTTERYLREQTLPVV